MAKEKKAWYKRGWAITLWIIIGLGIIGAFMDDSEAPTGTQKATKQDTTQQATTIQEKPKEIVVVSKSFEDDFWILCDTTATNLQKRDVFDNKLKNNYVEWTGIITSISESLGRYTLQVIHCPQTLISDITIIMKDDQKDKLLKYRENEAITYRAKLTRLGDILGLSATDGEVIE